MYVEFSTMYLSQLKYLRDNNTLSLDIQSIKQILQGEEAHVGPQEKWVKTS